MSFSVETSINHSKGIQSTSTNLYPSDDSKPKFVSSRLFIILMCTAGVTIIVIIITVGVCCMCIRKKYDKGQQSKLCLCHYLRQYILSCDCKHEFLYSNDRGCSFLFHPYKILFQLLRSSFYHT